MQKLKRIIKIVNTLYIIMNIWLKHRNLRLCQLLGNCFEEKDLYYFTDRQLIEALKKTYEKSKRI